jgi:hypothetical protein
MAETVTPLTPLQLVRGELPALLSVPHERPEDARGLLAAWMRLTRLGTRWEEPDEKALRNLIHHEGRRLCLSAFDARPFDSTGWWDGCSALDRDIEGGLEAEESAYRAHCLLVRLDAAQLLLVAASRLLAANVLETRRRCLANAVKRTELLYAGRLDLFLPLATDAATLLRHVPPDHRPDTAATLDKYKLLVVERERLERNPSAAEVLSQVPRAAKRKTPRVEVTLCFPGGGFQVVRVPADDLPDLHKLLEGGSPSHLTVEVEGFPVTVYDRRGGDRDC